MHVPAAVSVEPHRQERSPRRWIQIEWSQVVHGEAGARHLRSDGELFHFLQGLWGSYEYDQVFVVYNEFKSVVSQKVIVEPRPQLWKHL